MSDRPWEVRELALDRIEERLDPVLRRADDDTSSSHDLILDAAPEAVLGALYDAGLLHASEHTITITAGGWRLAIDYLSGWSCTCGTAGRGGHTKVVGAVRDAVEHVPDGEPFSITRPHAVRGSDG